MNLLRYIARTTNRRSSVPIGIALVLAIGTLLATSPAAFAHAAFKSATPADAATLEAAPKTVVIEFTKDIGDNVREASLVPPTGKAISDVWEADGARITIKPPRKMADGAWVVRWRVLGGDGHPLRGSSTFTVRTRPVAAEAGGATPTSAAPAVKVPAKSAPVDHSAHSMMSSYPHATLERIALTGRIMFFGGLLLFVGGMIFAIFAAPGWRPRYWHRMLAATVLGAVVVLGTHAAMLDERSLLGMLNPLVWFRDMVSVGVRGYVLAAALVVVIHVLRWQLEPIEWEERRAARPAMLVALVLGAAAAPSLSGHAADGTVLWLRIPLDMLHVLAGAAWLGGLVQLLTITVRERSLDPRMVAVVNRYSRIAGGSVAVLVVTGVYATMNELGAGLGELFGSAWGRLILLKVLLLVATLPLANANRLRHVPGVSSDPVRGIPKLRRYVALELLVIVWVVGATSALVYESPPSAATPAAAKANG